MAAYSQNVGDDSNGPAVDCFTVGLLGQNLRGCNEDDELFEMNHIFFHFLYYHRIRYGAYGD